MLRSQVKSFVDDLLPMFFDGREDVDQPEPQQIAIDENGSEGTDGGRS